MRLEIPIFAQLLDDTSLHPREIQVFRSAIKYLDLLEWRELKLVLIEHDLELDRPAVSRYINALVLSGYLCKKTGQTGGASLFRVPLSRRSCEEQRETTEGLSEPEPVTVPRPRTRPRVVSPGVL